MSTDNKVSPVRIEELMGSLTYTYTLLADGRTTICQATLPNGFNIALGQSACIDPANYDKDLGEKYAKERADQDARNELWKLEGYRLSLQLNPLE